MVLSAVSRGPTQCRVCPRLPLWRLSLVFCAAFFCLGFLCNPAHAAQNIPALLDPVADLANMISPAGEEKLNTVLQHLSREQGSTIAVFTVESLDGEAIASLSMRAAQKWSLGHADRDDGVLLTVARKERQIRIEVGEGIEGHLTDLESGQIIREVIQPLFRRVGSGSDYDEGFVAGVYQIAKRANPGLDIDEVFRSAALNPMRMGSVGGGVPFIVIVIFLIILLFVLSRQSRRRVYRGRGYWESGGRGPWIGGGGFGGGSFGGGGGGFGGGGGGFGGGGASGGW